MKDKSVDELVNHTYHKGLELKYELLLKHSKSLTGINAGGWNNWLIQQGISSNLINAKDLHLIFTNTVKEQ